MRKLTMLVLMAVAVVSATSAQGATQPALSLNVPGYKVLFGHKLALSGQLASGSAGQSVSLFSRQFGHTGMIQFATVKTGPTGGWSFKVQPTVNTTYQARAGSAVSRSVTIGVKPRVAVSQLGNGSIWAHIAAGQSFAGQLVELQKQDGTSWTTISKAALNGTSSTTFPAPVVSGTITLRIAMSVNQAGSGLLGANSNPLVFHAQFVSLVPAASKVLYGKPLTLSGRITNHKAGEIITILGWKYGHSAPVKTSTVTTRNGGFWTATAEPTIRTTYQAIWGKAHSGKVVIGVEPMVTLNTLPDGRITSHINAGVSFAGKKVTLQELRLGIGWRTVAQGVLDRHSSVVFPKLAASRADATLQVAMSVNQAGAGFLGSVSHTFIYHR